MRILVYSVNFAPELIGPAKYTTELCQWLATRGHDVVAIVPPPYYPGWRVKPPHDAWAYGTSIEYGVRVRRAPIWVPSKPSGIRRVLHTLSFTISSLPLLLAEAWRGADVVFVTEPAFCTLPPTLAAAWVAGAASYLHIQDFEVDLAYGLGQLRRGRPLAARVEGWIMPRFDFVSSISRRMLDRALSKGVDPKRLLLIPNWFDPEQIFPETRVSRFRRELRISDQRIVALYAGTLGAKQGIESIIEAARMMRDESIDFVICGEGVAQTALAANAPSNVLFIPLQPVTRLNELLNLADVHLLPQRNGTAGSLFPSKLVGMLASGRPVVAISAPDSEIAKCVEGCGICVDYDDIEGFCAALRLLANDPERRLALGYSARQRALEHFNKEEILQKFEAAITKQCQPQIAGSFSESTRGRI